RRHFMNPSDYLSHLLDQGIRLWVEGNRLRYRAPAGAMTKEILAVVEERKPELIRFLQINSHIGRSAPPIVPVARNGGLPLSFEQEGFWLIDQLQPGNTSYNIPKVLRVKGTLDSNALEQAVNEILRRHEI